ncbi:MAG: glucose-6-phosphate isomerase, partial [Casimicrobiaceae bacterium]
QRIARGQWQDAFDTLTRRDFQAQRRELFTGGRINTTEGRAATHMQARDDALAITSKQIETLSRHATALLEDGVETVLHLGIGGSDLGVRLVHQAFSAMGLTPRCRLRFASGVDRTEWRDALDGLDPRRCAFIVASKSFRTAETLELLARARDWLQRAGVDPERRLHAVTAQVDLAASHGIRRNQIAQLDESIGGRYAIWSALNLGLRAAWGDAPVAALLQGAHAMDRHFVRAPLDRNAPVLAAIARFVNRNRRQLTDHVIAPYSWGLRSLPNYLQQLMMESLGKRVTRDGEPVTANPCASVWGDQCTAAQHAFFQWLHQHPTGAAVDFIAVRPELNDASSAALFANAVAQAQALAQGFRPARGEYALEAHRSTPGGRPSTFIALPELSPPVLGALLSFYEASVFTEACFTGVNPFDQFGVEFGKALALDTVRAVVAGGSANLDAEALMLVRWARTKE